MIARRHRRVAIAMAVVLVAVGCAAPAPQQPASFPPAGPASPAPEPAVAGSPSPPACREEAGTVRWWHDRVFYEVFVRSFADADGDGIGDLRGLTERIDELNDGDPERGHDLGITGIWLMPVAEAASYHGYDVTDYRAVERDYGTTEDFRAFMEAAHARGIAVIVDLVLNHTSIDHPWFQESRDPTSARADWYRWSDTHPGYGGPTGQPAWHPDGDRFYYGQFWSGMPDLDVRNPEVTDELVDVARFWLEDMGVDGFRLDAVKHLVEDGSVQEHTPETLAWLEAFRARVKAVDPEALLLGEVFDPTLLSSRYVPEAVDLVFDFDLASQVLIAAGVGEGPSLATTQAAVLEAYGDAGYAAFLTNHDQARVMNELNDLRKARVAASALLTQPGVPFVYYGEEIGMAGGKPDERIRTPMPWTADPPGHGFTTGTPWEPLEPGWETANVELQAGSPGSLLEHYRSLIAVRAAQPALRAGTVAPLSSTVPTVYGFLATRGGDRVAVVINLGDEDVADFELALADGATCGIGTVAVAYRDGFPGPEADVAAPVVDATGRFTGWRPLPVLPAFSTLVLTLSE